MLSEFIKMYPQINLEVHFDDDYSDIIKDGFDAVVRFGEISDSRLFTKRIGALSMGVFHSSDYIPAPNIIDIFFFFTDIHIPGKSNIGVKHYNTILIRLDTKRHSTPYL